MRKTVGHIITGWIMLFALECAVCTARHHSDIASNLIQAISKSINSWINYRSCWLHWLLEPFWIFFWATCTLTVHMIHSCTAYIFYNLQPLQQKLFTARSDLCNGLESIQVWMAFQLVYPQLYDFPYDKDDHICILSHTDTSSFGFVFTPEKWH